LEFVNSKRKFNDEENNENYEKNKKFKSYLNLYNFDIDELHDKFYGKQNKFINEYPDMFNNIENRFNFVDIKKNIIIKNIIIGNVSGHYKKIIDLNYNMLTFINNIRLVIKNPLKLELNNLIKSIKITSSGQEYYRLDGDFNTHVNVLSKYSNMYYKHINGDFSEFNLGLIHNKTFYTKGFGLYLFVELFSDNDIYAIVDTFNLDIDNKTNPFYVDYMLIQSIENTQLKEYLYFNHQIKCLYLSDISDEDLKNILSISIILNDDEIFHHSLADIISYNKNNGINAITIPFIGKEGNNTTINFSVIDKPIILIETNNNKPIKYTINGLTHNVIGIYPRYGYQMGCLFAN
jgi:hypothetical protein